MKYAFLALFLLTHFNATAKNQVNLYCEISVEENISGKLTQVLKSVPLSETIDAEWDAQGSTYRVDEAEYQRVANMCERKNTHSGKVLPSIMAYIKSYVPFGSSYLPLGSKFRKEKYERAQETHKTIKRDPNKTMVVFFHGTCSNPIKDAVNSNYPNYDDGEKGGGELLSYLRNRMIEDGAVEGVDFISVHGVGSGNAQVPNFHTKFMVKDSYSDARGAAAGSGTAENIENTILHLKGKTENPAMEEVMGNYYQHIKSVGKLIVIGWSRGAVTAIQFAHDLYKDPELKDIIVHMFAIDPVPGLGNMTLGMWKNIFYLYPNVKNYFGMYAQDERSVGFTPVIPRVSDSSSLFSSRKAMIISEMPGAHPTMVGNTWNQKEVTDANASVARQIPTFASVARITRGLAQTFIVSHGGHLTGIEYHANAPLNTMDEMAKLMLQDFSTIAKDMSDFDILRSQGYLMNARQMSGNDRKYHQDWNVFGYKKLNDWIQPVLPRYTAKDIPGFKIKYNQLDNERTWVNHLHKVLAVSYFKKGHFDITEFFNPGYYKKYQAVIKSKQ